MNCLYSRTRDTLKQARERYGFEKEILVCIEELNELASVLAKYGRYDFHDVALDSLRKNVLNELADVFNAIDHIQAVFDIDDKEILVESAQKGDRLLFWMHNNPTVSMEDSTKERDIPKKPCPLCAYNGSDPFKQPCIACAISEGYPGFYSIDND